MGSLSTNSLSFVFAVDIARTQELWGFSLIGDLLYASLNFRLRMSMKGTLDELHYSVELLEESAALRDVIDKHIHDQTLVSIPFCCVVVSFIVPFLYWVWCMLVVFRHWRVHFLLLTLEWLCGSKFAGELKWTRFGLSTRSRATAALWSLKSWLLLGQASLFASYWSPPTSAKFHLFKQKRVYSSADLLSDS